MEIASIQAILFDMGGTLRTITVRDEAARNERVQRIIDLVGGEVPAADLAGRLVKRAAAYKAWADESLVELTEAELWSRWMLPEWPAGQIKPLGVKLNQLWIDSTGTRYMIPGAREVILELYRRGYRLALVSNTTSSTDAKQALRDQHISGLFETVVLSCQYGRKKPDAGMLVEAAAQMALPPEACAYVGNDLLKDVTSARQAGYGLAVLVRRHQSRSSAPASVAPDCTVDSLEDLLDLFPVRVEKAGMPGNPPVDAALSTMWAIRNFPSLAEFCEGARRLGFTKIELNHQVHSAMLSDLDLNGLQVSSVHEPCPADTSTEILREEDWLISATDETKRRKGVEAICRSIDLAYRLGAPVIVVHAGNVQADVGLERELIRLIKAGQRDTGEYEALRERFMHQRAEMAAPRLGAVKKSLLELLDYARPYKVCLGLENRYHYMDVPLPDELEMLLQLAGPDRLGIWLDTGHARALGVMGLVPEDEWIRCFSGRIVGLHFHDAAGTSDHRAPGQGEINFDRYGRLLPAGAVRTFEIKPNTPAVELRKSMNFLIEKGCVQTL